MREGLVAALDHALLRHPGGQFGETATQRDRRLEPEQLARSAHVGEAVADVAGAELARDVRLKVGSQRVGHQPRQVQDARAPAGGHVDGLTRGGRRVHSGARGTHDVRHVNEAANLVAILEHERGPAVRDTGGEDRRHAGVRVGKRLPRAVR